jgi:hypothetical protein
LRRTRGFAVALAALHNSGVFCRSGEAATAKSGCVEPFGWLRRAVWSRSRLQRYYKKARGRKRRAVVGGEAATANQRVRRTHPAGVATDHLVVALAALLQKAASPETPCRRRSGEAASAKSGLRRTFRLVAA